MSSVELKNPSVNNVCSYSIQFDTYSYFFSFGNKTSKNRIKLNMDGIEISHWIKKSIL